MGNRNVQATRCPPDHEHEHEHADQIRANVLAIQTAPEHEHRHACRPGTPPPPPHLLTDPRPPRKVPRMPPKVVIKSKKNGSKPRCPVYLRLPIRAAKESDHGKKV